MQELIKLGVEGDTSSAYELMHILENQIPDANLVFEIHELASDVKQPSEEFIKRSRDLYDSFIRSSLVDQWPSENISYAVRLNGLWFAAINMGSNTYIGSGPGAVLQMRSFCKKQNIRILFVEDNFNEWFEKICPSAKKLQNEEEPTQSKIYQQVIDMIKQTGDGLCRDRTGTAKFNEQDLRSQFATALETHIESFTILRESHEGRGRTDLVFEHKKLHRRFKFEFKIHRTSSDLKKGVQQITRQYSSQSPQYNGLVILNRKKIDLSRLMDNIEKIVRNSGLKILKVNAETERHILYVTYQHPNDSHLISFLTVFIFDIQE